MNKTKLICAILTGVSLTIVGCNTNSSSSIVGNSSSIIESSSVEEEGTLKVLNVKQYLGYSEVKIDTYLDNVLTQDLDLYYDIIDTSICEIVNGYVRGKVIGQTEVYASTVNGQEVSFTVYIKNPIEYTFNTAVNTIEEAYTLKESPANPTLFIGDSFFDDRNFWRTFYDDFSEQQNVFSAGISSSQTTDWVIARDRLIFEFEPKNIVMHIGTNDINDGSVQLTVEQYYQQITHLLTIVCEQLPTTPIYYFGIENRTVSSGYGARNIYAEKVTKKIQEEFSLRYSNFHYIDSPSVFNANQAKYISFDGIHPSSDGYRYYTEILNEIVTFKN